jgi:hypothetical protein
MLYPIRVTMLLLAVPEKIGLFKFALQQKKQ